MMAFMYLNYSAMKRFSAHQKVPETYSLKQKAVFFPFRPVFPPSQWLLLQLTLVTKSCTPTMRGEKIVKCPNNFD